MNGGYTLLDLTKYDISTIGDVADAVEISEEEYNEIYTIIKNSYDRGKIVFVKAFAYDEVKVLSSTVSVATNSVDNRISISYRNAQDNANARINIEKSNDKYIIYCQID